MGMGIFIAEPGGSIADSNLQYDSTKSHLQCDLAAVPAHMDFVPLPTATAFVDTGTAEVKQREVLFEIKHGYDFIPYTLAYILVERAAIDQSGFTVPIDGGYGNDAYYIESGLFEDYIEAEVNEEYFRIVHIMQSYGFNTGSVSTAPKYSFKAKYYITSSLLGI